MPDTFAQSAEGVLLIANGINPMLRWDGYEDTAVTAGVVAPTAQPSLSGAGTGAITGTYRAYVRFVDKYGNFSNLSPASADAVLTNSGQVNYAALAIPEEAKVVRRQVLRNTAGQLRVFYVDIDTTDTTGTTLTSFRADAELSAQTAAVLFDADGFDLANQYTPPPNHTPFIAAHLTRMWAAGVVTYAEGSVAVTAGSTTVTVTGGEWFSTFVGRFLHVTNATRVYEIASVDPVVGTLELLDAYEDATDPFAAYAVRPAPAYANLLSYSMPGLPEAWPATNALALPEDGDVVTGLMPMGSFLYILKRRVLYRVTAQTDPGRDGFIFRGATRGCINNRCWVIADEVAYLLDEGGMYAYGGTDQGRNVSTPVQDIFRGGGQRQVNWSASRFFHASHSPQEETVRFFVSMNSDYLPRHALCYGYRVNKFWIEEYPVPIGASALGRLGRLSGVWQESVEQVFLGSSSARVMALGRSPFDGLPADTAADRGRVASSGTASLTAAGTAFPEIDGASVAIVSGRGRGQVRLVTAVDSSTLKIDRPWAVKPDATSVFQVGGFAYRLLTTPMRVAPSEDREGLSAELTFDPSPTPAFFKIVSRAAKPWRAGAPAIGVNLSADKGDDANTLDLSAVDGAVLVTASRHRESQAAGVRFVSLDLDGVACDPPVRLGMTVVNGVT